MQLLKNNIFSGQKRPSENILSSYFVRSGEAPRTPAMGGTYGSLQYANSANKRGRGGPAGVGGRGGPGGGRGRVGHFQRTTPPKPKAQIWNDSQRKLCSGLGKYVKPRNSSGVLCDLIGSGTFELVEADDDDYYEFEEENGYGASYLQKMKYTVSYEFSFQW